MDQELIRFEGHPDKDNLKKLLKERQEEALSNLITKSTPKDVIFQKPARGGSNELDYVPGWWFIDQLNSLFAFNWSFQIVKEVVDDKIGQVWVSGRLTIPLGSDTIIKENFGSSDIKKYSKGNNQGRIIDIGDDLKSAATDALKKCCSQLGLAADVYGHRERLDNSKAGLKQLKVLYSIGEKKGMTIEQVDEWVKKTSGKEELDELAEVDILDLMGKLRALKSKEQ